MSNITTCKVLNKTNENESEELTICTEWNDLKAKMFIMRSDKPLLKGEILLEDFNQYAKAFDKTLEDYIDESRSILSGNNDDIKFILKNNTFSWKRKHWCLGKISVTSDREVECLRKFTTILVDEYLKNKKETDELKNNNATLIKRCSILDKKINEIIKLKKEMEQTLYQKSRLIINSKKAKIRILSSKLNENHNDPIFDATTDESDTDVDFKDKPSDDSTQLNQLNAQKRKLTSVSNEKKIDNTVKKTKKSENNEKTKKFETPDTSKNTNSIELKVNGEIINENLSKDIKTFKKNYEPVASTSKGPSIDALKKDSITDISNCENKKAKMEIGQNNIEPVPSTSKELDITKPTNLNCGIGEDDETPDLFDNESCKSDESECEVQLQLEDEKECAINEDNSEEEMFFSQ